jgi:hypothetical protein
MKILSCIQCFEFFNVLYEGFYLDSIMHYVVQWFRTYLLTKVNFNFI